ncbi:MAG: hypothetical protein E7627_04095 [Ruminococcaceae bacterium]|nr:hypothetical protein [Oscillospiraceae bacterium]
MYKGTVGVFLSGFVKLTLTVMIMLLVLWGCSLIGYYDAPELALGAGSFETLVNNVLGADYGYYGIEVVSGWGIFGTIFSVGMELICKISSVEYSPDMFTSAVAVNLILTAVMASISVSVPMKLYLAMARNMNRKVSGIFGKGFSWLIDIIAVALIAFCGVLSAAGLTRRVSILTAGLPSWLNFIVYIAILIGISAVLALIDGRLRNCSGKFFKGFLQISGELLYSVLVAAESLCILATFLIFKSAGDNAGTAEYNILGVGVVLIIILIATVLISNRKK